ncbi:MAG: hypothetical protein LBN34_07440 [Clostridiales Family XIII bacterium]|jgi:hypothetical protein|nr:hypothetical protein [Clostridiales Family XIII bacterium]
MDNGENNIRGKNYFQRVFWGVGFLVAGAALVLNQVGLIGAAKLNFWTILISLLLLAILIQSLMNRFWFGIILPLAGGALLYRDIIGIPAEITWWSIMGAAILLSVGLTILFRPLHKSKYVGGGYSKVSYDADGEGLGDGERREQKGHERFEDVIDGPDGDEIYTRASFGSTIKYVNSENMKKAILECSFGAMKVYFDNAKPAPEGAEIFVDLSFGAMEIYIPREWRLTDNIGRSFSGIEEKNRCRLDENSPSVNITGNTSFSGLTIIYV